MATLVCFHAHPDDESSSTAGLLLSAAAAGHRTIVVTATDGSLGEVHIDLDPNETLAERRADELAAALTVLGCEGPNFLGYVDSGMMGEPSNDNPACFWQADQDEAADKLAQILTEVGADVLTVYDDHGGYGHPDHIQVHRVGLLAARKAGIANVYEATMNRDAISEMVRNAPNFEDFEQPPEPPDESFLETFGTAENDISFVVDAQRFATKKRAALACHASQLPPENFFLAMPDDLFEKSFGFESFNLPSVTNTGGPKSVDLLPPL